MLVREAGPEDEGQVVHAGDLTGSVQSGRSLGVGVPGAEPARFDVHVGERARDAAAPAAEPGESIGRVVARVEKETEKQVLDRVGPAVHEADGRAARLEVEIFVRDRGHVSRVQLGQYGRSKKQLLQAGRRGIAMCAARAEHRTRVQVGDEPGGRGQRGGQRGRPDRYAQPISGQLLAADGG